MKSMLTSAPVLLLSSRLLASCVLATALLGCGGQSGNGNETGEETSGALGDSRDGASAKNDCLVSGRVLDVDGNGAAGLTVVLTAESQAVNSDVWFFSGVTDRAGRYSLSKVACDRRWVSVIEPSTLGSGSRSGGVLYPLGDSHDPSSQIDTNSTAPFNIQLKLRLRSSR
jgi:hypothetical protein